MMLKQIYINNIPIGINYKPLIIAEMSGNHNQSIERAKKIIDEAAAAGVDAIKLQTHTPDGLTIDSNKDDFIIQDI